MHGWLVLQLLILLIVANGTAVLAKKVLGGTFGRPLDGGATFIDGQPLFGPSKTIRGVVASLLGTSICAELMGLGWQIGSLIAVFAIAGDLFSSFVKRRLRLTPSSMAIGLDHIPEVLFSPSLPTDCCCRSILSILWSGLRFSWWAHLSCRLFFSS